VAILDLVVNRPVLHNVVSSLSS